MKKLIFLVVLASSFSVMATVDSIGRVKIPYIPVHAEQDFGYLAENWSDQYSDTKMFCMTESMYWDEYSSSSMPTFERMVKPFVIPVIPGHSPDFKEVQINALSNSKITVETDWERFEKYVEEGAIHNNWIHEPEFTVDVSGYDQSTAAGRLEALTMAKLAIISLHYNLSQFGQLFRLKVIVKGLPADQSEFVKEGFSKVYAQTKYPYSGPSPVAQAYYDELLSTEFCPRTVEEVKKFREGLKKVPNL